MSSRNDLFKEFIDNLQIDKGKIEAFYKRLKIITTLLNQKFRDDNKEDNTLIIGSFGRRTGMNRLSDFDVLYLMPEKKWKEYKDNGQSRLLESVKKVISETYSTTEIERDRYIIKVSFTDFHIEVQPVFENLDGSFNYPDTYDDGKWKITKPRDEMKAIERLDKMKNGVVRHLCQMVRAWREEYDVNMSGLLIDTLVYNFFTEKSQIFFRFSSYGNMVRDFFKYLSEEKNNREIYLALGSNQNVKVHENFQSKAGEVYNLCIEAIEKDENSINHEIWRDIFGDFFPFHKVKNQYFSSLEYRNTEENIEDKYNSSEIQKPLTIYCDIPAKKGYIAKHFTSKDLNIPIITPKSKLIFSIKKIPISEPYDIIWKVLNRGNEAKKRDCIRGQLFKTEKSTKKEVAEFRGDHYVECYIIKNNLIVARERINVLIRGYSK